MVVDGLSRWLYRWWFWVYGCVDGCVDSCEDGCVDSCVGEMVEMGLNVKAFEIDKYICWGTPNDYKTYKYWQSFFHKEDWHPYTLSKDITMNLEKTKTLDKEYKIFEQEWR